MTGRRRTIPASRRACSSGSPFFLVFFMHLLNEIEKHDDVADDNANQVGGAEKSHEAEGRAHHVEGDESANDAVRSGSENEKRLDGVTKLDHESKKNQEDRDGHDYGEIAEALFSFGLLATDDDAVAGGKILAQFGEFGSGGGEHFGGKRAGLGETLHGNGTEVLE